MDLMKMTLAAGALLALTACDTAGVGGAAVVDASAAAGAADLAAFQAAGATQVTAADFADRIVGKTMTEVGGGWTWIIRADGTHASAAADGSWGGEDGAWELQGNAYCVDRADLGCRDVWMLGPYLRLVDSAGALGAWTVIVP
jgi:hypothetical protein